MNKLNRRNFIVKTLFSSGALGLKSLVTGLPISFFTHRAMAAGNAQYFVLSARRAGDPVNANVPGTYEHSEIAHALSAELGPIADGFENPSTFMLGTQQVRAASVWANLSSDLRDRLNFFHHRSNTNGHNELNSVLNLFGSITPNIGRSPEMLLSAIAQETQQQLGTQLKAPIALADGLEFEGIGQGTISPSSLKSLFEASNRLNGDNIRKYRDQQLDLIYQDVKSNGTPAQKEYLNSHAIASSQALTLTENLASFLTDINGNSADDQAKAAVALFALNVTPGVRVSFRFGGDNHADNGLTNEVNQHIEGTGAIQTLWDELKRYNLQDKTSFSIFNVFGRTLSKKGTSGRDHYGDHTVMISFGPNINAGVIGGLTNSGRRNQLAAGALNSNDGSTTNSDIPANQTLHSAAKSLMSACGISDERVSERITAGKVVKSYVKG